jgi:hypothetical protein
VGAGMVGDWGGGKTLAKSVLFIKTTKRIQACQGNIELGIIPVLQYQRHFDKYENVSTRKMSIFYNIQDS